ncbi:hypothetical protein ACFWHW_25820 [Streptomyces pharetrae]|uniref:hypothetical protein n=1 Tax=Streptomyces pharetrae TaxID=291370 RepID=UPI001302D6B8
MTDAVGNSATHRGGDAHQVDGPPPEEAIEDPHTAERNEGSKAGQDRFGGFAGTATALS